MTAKRKKSTRGHGERRSRFETAFLSALLRKSTVAEAAREAGISDSTATRWLSDPAFKERLKSAQDEVINHSLSMLKLSASEALEVLRSVANDEVSPPSARVAAARTLLDGAFRAVETYDILSRIETLETRTEGNGNR
jgi:hypothetical protein